MRLGLFALCISSSFIANLALATQDIGTQFGIRSRAMGKAGRAISTTNEAMYLNPAGMSQFTRFTLDTDYIYRIDDPMHFVGLSLVDSTTRPFAGGVDFHLGIDPAQGTNALSYLGAVALSFALVQESVFLGATGKYAYLPASASDPMEVQKFGMDAGMLVRFPFGLSLAATGYNLIPTNSQRLPLSVGLGAALNIGSDCLNIKDLIGAFSGLTLAFDWLFSDITNVAGYENILHAGAEYLLLESVPLRFGYSYFLVRMEHELSGGLGIITRDFGLEGFYEQNIVATHKRSFGVLTTLFF